MSHRQLFASGETIREQKDEIARLQAEIERLRLTDAERALIEMLADHPVTHEIMPNEVATLRGLLERLSDRPQAIATPEPPCTPAECRLPAGCAETGGT